MKHRALCFAGLVGLLSLSLLSGCFSDDTEEKSSTATTDMAAATKRVEQTLIPPKDADADLNLHVAFLDIGAGNCALLTTPGGRNLLIDAGPPGAEKAILAWLKQHKITRLEDVVVTSPTREHIGALPALLAALPFERVFEAGLPIDSPEEEALRKAVKAHHNEIHTARAGAQVILARGVQIEFLAPEEHLDKPTGDRSAWIDNHTLVFRIRYGSTSLLFTGDMGPEERDGLYASATDLQSTVLCGLHHGDRKVADVEMIHRVLPIFGVLSCAPGNKQGYPHQETLDAFKTTMVPFSRTDLQGDITLHCNNRGRVSVLIMRAAPQETLARGGTPVANAADDHLHVLNLSGGADRTDLQGGPDLHPLAEPQLDPAR